MLTLIRTKATNLVPGTIVRNEDGSRLYAAFDVEPYPFGAETVMVWTAVRDQEAGQPETLRLRADEEVLVAAEPAETAEPAELPESPTAFEARCLACGETFNPSEKDELEHYASQDGTECGGPGVITGWF